MPNKIVVVLLLCLVFTGLGFNSDCSGIKMDKRVCVVVLHDGDSEEFKGQVEALKKELDSLLDDDVPRINVKTLTAGWDSAKVGEIVRQAMEDDKVDLIVSAGQLTSVELVKFPQLKKPVIATTLIDPYVYGLVSDKGYSTKDNFTFISNPNRAQSDIKAFKQLVDFKTLYVVIDQVLLGDVERYSSFVEEKLNLKMKFISVSDNVDDVIKELDWPIEAIYITPLQRLGDEDFMKVVNAINEKKIPTFSYNGQPDVKKGVLAGLAPDIQDRKVRRTALNIQRILSGEDTSEISVLFDTEDLLTINMQTARKIGISPDFDILLQAQVIDSGEGESSESGRRLTIKDAVYYALKNNFLFDVKSMEIEKSKQNYNIFWSGYFPNAAASWSYDAVDSETARISNGLYAKKKETYSLSVRQVVFSDPLISNIRSSKKKIEISKLEYESAKLDIIEQTSKQYLEYLKAKSLYRIRTSELKRIIYHLGLAKRRLEVGTAGPEEVYRLKSDEAAARANIIRAESNVFKQKVILNELMNRPQETNFIEEDVVLETMNIFSSRMDFWGKVNNRKNLLEIIDFMVVKGLELSPEIKALNVSIDAQNIQKNRALRKWFLPEVSASGALTHNIHSKFYSSVVPENKHDDWTAGITASYSILEGGRIFYDYNFEVAEWKRLKFKAELSKQEVERLIRNSVYALYYSHPNIELSRIAEENIKKNLEVVEDKYAKGKVSITDLIDAQDTAFSKEIEAAISVYNYLQDLMTLERRVSFFEFMSSEKEKDAMLEELMTFMGNEEKKSV